MGGERVCEHNREGRAEDYDLIEMDVLVQDV